MDKVTYILHDGTREEAAHAFVDAPDGSVFTLAPSTRTIRQNAFLHALFGLIAKQLKYHGRVFNAIQWKTLLISGHSMATQRGVDLIPGIEGEFVNVRESSAHMGVARMNSLLEYVLAYATTNGVRIPAGKGYEEFMQ
ncbi:recombination protein NinB [Paraburkholderia phosphatilytica]|uniref:recombination protein NinB n=1 Tax=Paraburkholderia phosphatilytica TaxID=2282883 RepID=UPI000E4D1E12|nr:recombination protein NinB [Paraburkholderia phosphatilytica]